MKAYKYKALSNFEHVADIFCNKRFYAAQFFDLNDPMEGMFHAAKGTKREYLDRIREGKRNLRICSFSKEFRNLLLWAHYADGFRGICIEVDLAEWPEHEVAEVKYRPHRLIFNNHQAQYAEFWPNAVLREKNTAWKYEQEVRVLTQNEFVSHPVVTINAVLLGARTPDPIRAALLRVVPTNVRVWETKISRKTNRVIKAQQCAEADA